MKLYLNFIVVDLLCITAIVHNIIINFSVRRSVPYLRRLVAVHSTVSNVGFVADRVAVA
jgi:hypothetical protein